VKSCRSDLPLENSGLQEEERAFAINLRGRASVRELYEEERAFAINQALPSDDNAMDTLLNRRAVEGVKSTAARMKGTTFSRVMLQGLASCGVVFEAIASIPNFAVRL
jgi:hypothetical protein